MRGVGVENVPVRGPAILACNHQSYLDPVLVGAFAKRTLHYMARDTLFHNRAFGRLIRNFNAFPVKRGTADVGAIKESLRRLRAGHALLMFPEGTRTTDGRVRPMQPGVIAIARRSGAAIVPVALEGVFEAWPRDRKLPRWAPMAVKFGAAIAPEELEKLEDAAAADLLTARIRALQNELRARAGRPPFEYAAAADNAEATLPTHCEESRHGGTDSRPAADGG
ncbi:MAG: 1-acyl-sn-glycerol-3-phosphate acyltransferase [Phycisphaerales bacterium]|nr:1-acyl-sn-glycerol-3-phosphate acyltransferase [Phycisphaerales bacterium]